MSRQVFISYASEDFAIADRLCRALENTGSTCWMAPRDIPPGTDYPAAIVDAIRQATVLVLVLTDMAAQSPHILSEVGHAFNAKKRIIPFRVSTAAMPAELEYFLSMTQWLDAEEGATGENVKRLIGAVRAGLRGASMPVERARVSRVKVVSAGVALAVALGGGGAAYWMRGRPKTVPPAPVAAPPRSGAEKEPAPPSSRAEKQPAPPVKAPAAEAKPSSWVNPADRQTYLWIPPGTFTMGCSPGDDQCGADEKPAHPVKIATGFWLARTEVTIAAYRTHAQWDAIPGQEGGTRLPVTGVTWQEAKKYCAAVGGRLPAEAEWEYAARAGGAAPYYGVVAEIAWYAGNSDEVPHPVQTREPNAFGLYDMLGNAGEWVLDRYYNRYYFDAPATGSKIEQPLSPNASATARGGFFAGGPETVRVSRRVAIPPDEPSQAVGFRCVAEHPAP